MNVEKELRRTLERHTRKEYADAESCYRRLLYHNPNSPEILRLLGLCIAQQGRPEEAKEYSHRAFILAPSYDNALANLAAVEGALGNHEKAEELCDRCLELNPSHYNARFTRGLARLSMGDWPRGWGDYEAGFASGDRQLRITGGNVWRGGPLPSGSTLLLWWEQGFGDTIMFSRFVKQAKEWAGPGVFVKVEVQRGLKNLLRDLPGADAVLGDDEELGRNDYNASLLSLPYLFGLTPEMAAAMWDVPYVDAKEDWGKEVAAYGGVPVGLCTEGNREHVNDRNRSVHDFSLFQPLLDVWPAKIHSLVLGRSLHPFKTFDELAGIVRNLELVITVDTAVAHLAGAMGKEVWTLLPDIGCDFRWMRGWTNTCFYPTMRLWRRTDGNWKPVIDAMARTLKERMHGC